jgi:hypothetical protein
MQLAIRITPNERMIMRNATIRNKPIFRAYGVEAHKVPNQIPEIILSAAARQQALVGLRAQRGQLGVCSGHGLSLSRHILSIVTHQAIHSSLGQRGGGCCSTLPGPQADADQALPTNIDGVERCQRDHLPHSCMHVGRWLQQPEVMSLRVLVMLGKGIAEGVEDCSRHGAVPEAMAAADQTACDTATARQRRLTAAVPRIAMHG